MTKKMTQNTFAEQVWFEISNAHLGSTRFLNDVKWTKVPGFGRSESRWTNPYGRILTDTQMYEATVNP